MAKWKQGLKLRVVESSVSLCQTLCVWFPVIVLLPLLLPLNVLLCHPAQALHFLQALLHPLLRRLTPAALTALLLALQLLQQPLDGDADVAGEPRPDAPVLLEDVL